MFTAQGIYFFINTIALIAAYIFCVTTAGFFLAWAAKKAGDDTPELAGFLTWNPIMHIDPIGALCMLVFDIGWGKLVPINYANIKNNIARAFVFFAKPIAYMGIALISLLFVLRMVGMGALGLVLYNGASLAQFAALYPESSSLVLTVVLFFSMMIYISLLFAVLNIIIGTFRYLTATQGGEIASLEQNILGFLILLVLMTFFAHPVRQIIIYVIATIARFVAPLIGVA